MLAFGIVYVVFLISRKGAFTYMPLKLKISLIGFLCVSLGYDAISVICDPRYSINVCSDKVHSFISALDMIVYLAVDWLFASHYLKVASLFRVTFSSHHSMEHLEQVRRRKKWLLMLDIVVYSMLLPILVMNEVVSNIVYFCVMWTIALVSLLSMRHI